MGITQTEIANRALIKLGDLTIIDVNADDEKAILVRNAWNSLRDDELRSHAWSFAIKRELLPALARPPAWEYAYAYQLPADCLRVISAGDEVGAPVDYSVYNPAAGSKYKIEGRELLTDFAPPLRLRYVARIENASLWDACFIECFACRLAAELAHKLIGSGSARQLAWQEYEMARRKAYTSNAIELPPSRFPDTESVGVRL